VFAPVAVAAACHSSLLDTPLLLTASRLSQVKAASVQDQLDKQQVQIDMIERLVTAMAIKQGVELTGVRYVPVADGVTV